MNVRHPSQRGSHELDGRLLHFEHVRTQLVAELRESLTAAFNTDEYWGNRLIHSTLIPFHYVGLALFAAERGYVACMDYFSRLKQR